MNSNVSRGYVDPDYEFASVAAERKKIQQEKDQNEAQCKAQRILNQQFENELRDRQKQLEPIQERISKAQKTLHLLRYAIVTSYYSRKELEVSVTETSNVKENSDAELQNRIHPALKRLIGKDSANLTCIYGAGLRKRQKLAENICKTEKKHSKPVKDNDLLPKMEVKAEKTENSVDIVRNRRKQKYRIVIGNISKWMPSEGSTHKWMVYVRGPKENPNISSIVSKVVFHLHPSYKPNDVIEVKSSPFHLSRRGWGEFPMRIKLYFHSSLNKPVDVIHNLKLDRSYSGQQILGNETILDVQLYENINPNSEESSSSFGFESIKHEPIDCDNIKEEIVTQVSEESEENEQRLFEHDYCYKDNLEQSQIPSCILDHDYCVPHGQKLIKVEGNNEDLNVNSIASPSKSINNQALQVEQFNSAKNMTSIYFPIHHFKNTIESLSFLLKRLPLITKLASNSSYKVSHPYAASSFVEYSSWIYERRLSAEWFRAKLIKDFIRSTNLADHDRWDTKSIVMFARAYGFVPIASYDIFKKTDHNYNFEFFIEHPDVETSPRSFILKTSDVELDIEGEGNLNKENRVKGRVGKLIDPNFESQCTFVRQCAFDVGVVLKPEELIPDIVFNSSERAILQATLCLAENLIRKARASQVIQGDFNENECVITVEDVIKVLHHRSELKFINK